MKSFEINIYENIVHIKKYKEILDINKFCIKISENKNLLMLFSAFIYILALYATLSESLILISMMRHKVYFSLYI